MKRVVESLPDPAQMAACGLTRRDYRIDAGTYRHFTEIYHRDLLAFARQFGGADPAAAPEERAAAEACREAFEASLPPYHYYQGSFYRCRRADRAAGVDQPLLLESYGSEEITGWVGIPPLSHHRSLLLEFLDWILGRNGKPPTGKEPPR